MPNDKAFGVGAFVEKYKNSRKNIEIVCCHKLLYFKLSLLARILVEIIFS